MKLAIVIFCLFATISASSPAQQQGPSSWDKYIPRTLQAIMDQNQGLLADMDSTASDPNKEILLTANSFPSTVTLVYRGESRPIPSQHKTLVQYWATMLKRPEDLADVFGTEMLFKEGDKEYWIPVQKPLLPYLPKEIKVGETFVAYVGWVGCIKNDDQWDWLFIMNEFDTPDSKPPTSKPGKYVSYRFPPS